MHTQPNLYFCFPYRGIGGVSLLFLRLGEYLADVHGAQVTLIDYVDGYMARHKRSGAVTLLEYRSDEPCFVPEGATLVLQSMNPWSIFPRLTVHSSVRLVFWNFLPFNLVPAPPGLRNFSYRHPALLKVFLHTLLASRRRRNASLIRAMYEKRSIFFQDDENVTVSQDMLGVSIANPILVPIPGPDGDKATASVIRRTPSDTVRVVWVGRLADFKYTMLIRALRDLDAVATARLKVTIVGAGQYAEAVRKCTSTLANIDVNMISEVPPHELSSFLRGQADIFIGMGTSALEAGCLGIPTILLDVSYGSVSEAYRYRWLNEEKGYAVGRVLYGNKSYPVGRPIDELIAEYVAHPDELSARVSSYYQSNHSLPTVAAKFLANIGRAQYQWGDLEKSGAIRRDLIYRVFVKLRTFAAGGKQ